MYRRSVRLLPLTTPFYFKSQLTNEGNSSTQMYRRSVQLLPLTTPFYFKSQLTNEGNSSIQMYRRSVRLLPLAFPFYFKSQFLMREPVASRCIVRVCNCYLEQFLSILSFSYL